MKKSLSVLFAVVFVLALATIAMAASTPGTGIKGTYHDLSSLGRSNFAGDTNEQANTGENSLDRICIYCHTPHNARKAEATGGRYTYVPLWNHEVTAQTTWQMYANSIDGTNAQILAQNVNLGSFAMTLATAPGSVSLLCLSCHDGSVAANSYGVNWVNPGFVTNPSHHTSADAFVTARAVIGGGGDLSNHHPIGFDYSVVQLADTGLYDQTAPVVAGAGGPTTIAELMWGGGIAGARMECVSCHSVHNRGNAGWKFVWVLDNQSNFCLTCHIK